MTKSNTRDVPKGVEYQRLIEGEGSSRTVHNLERPPKNCYFRLALILATILVVIFYSARPAILYVNETSTHPDWEEAFITKDDEQHFNYNSSYFVNTVGCKMPSFPIVDEHIQKFIERPQPLNCKPALIESDSNSIWYVLTPEDIQKHYEVGNVGWIECCYQAFERESNNHIRNVSQEKCFKFGERVQVVDEFIAVYCNQPTKNQTIFYRDYFAFVTLKPTVEERCENKTNEQKAQSGGDDDKLSVMILGIDSVSRLNFHRQMKRTAEMVIDRLKAVELFGYSKVGDNTYPNLVPVLTGLNLDELKVACHPYPNSTFDPCPFIWKRYSEAGYRTFYTEDSSSMDTFNYCKYGFRDQPTDYYLRNYFRLADKFIGYNLQLNAKLCMGGRSPTQILVEYARKLVLTMKDRLTFSLLWGCAVTHDFFNHPTLVDEDYRNALEYMEREGFFNKSVVMLLSDHGMRFGDFRETYQGMMEDRQPFLYVLLPTWFQQRYPSAYHNLRKNRQRLTTHFDLHETLKDLSNLSLLSQSMIKLRSLELLEMKPIPRGISLFLSIPPTRTCKDAGITPHWCTCHDHKPIATNDSRVMAVVRYTVDSLNQMLIKYPQCAVLGLDSIVDASHAVAPENGRKHQFTDINIRFLTKPGEAEFEATVRIDSFNRSSLTGSVSRTNLYGKQSYCVDDCRIKLYCFCT